MHEKVKAKVITLYSFIKAVTIVIVFYCFIKGLTRFFKKNKKLKKDRIF